MTTLLFLFSVKTVDVFLSAMLIPEFGEKDPFLGGGDVTDRLLLKSVLAGRLV